MHWLRKMMMGRYGFDYLGGSLLVFGLIISMIGRIIHLRFLQYIAFALLLYAWIRIFSRQINRRRAENQRWLTFSAPYREKMYGYMDRMRQAKTHCFFKCPSCKQQVRVPRGHGRIQITCPKCKTTFIRET